ncbi:hypothetical protein TELCIR_23937, partial [Teladorsagia circumcincta]
MKRELKTAADVPKYQYVALWYKHGEPVFGRAYPGKDGKMGLEYKWMTLADGRADEAKKWEPVHVGTAAPAVCVDDDGVEVLGCMNLTNETASIGFQGKQK